MGEKLENVIGFLRRGFQGKPGNVGIFFSKVLSTLITHIETGHYVKKYQNLFFQFWGTFNSLNLVT